jgi:glycogen phosphorylase
MRTAEGVSSIKQAILDHLQYSQGRTQIQATINDWYIALALTVRDRLMQRAVRTVETIAAGRDKVVCYLSAEFLLGPHLDNNLVNLGIRDEVAQAVGDLGLDLTTLIEQEEEPGLGNGGLGRLAACYMESLSTVEIPAVGYGIRYEFGIFDQMLRDGWQVEITDKWLRFGNPWEIHRPEAGVRVKFGGRTQAGNGPDGRYRVQWVPDYEVRGEPYDTPIVGYRTNTANVLRLWSAVAMESFDFAAFDEGDYVGAVENKIRAENISKILYPNDNSEAGRRLRLVQQYFFVSCSLQDLLARAMRAGRPLGDLPNALAVQMNDTHPSIAVAELMRLLIDEYGMDWDPAWAVTQATLGYTNHTLLPEALERWPIGLFGSVLPRHLEIVLEINRRFLEEVRARFPGDEARLRRMSLIDESGERFVRMAHLATVGSHAINGVAALHSELLVRDVLHDFHELYPDRFFNVTNGVTPRRWVLVSNPALSDVITGAIGDRWPLDADALRTLEPHAVDAGFRRSWRDAKRVAKEKLARYVSGTLGISLDPASLFDVQVKRIHEYKRQHLNALHIASLYLRLKDAPGVDLPPRTFLFGGKAAPGYRFAKLIIRFINGIAATVNADPGMRGRLAVVYLPDFNVRLGQRVYPAAELSEQISTAGKEASGTGNMKFAMNGALTIGTLDGANVEIRERVGAENFFLFGLTAAEAAAARATHRPREVYERDAAVRAVIDAIGTGTFSNGDRDLFRPLVDNLLNDDPFLVLADFSAYARAQADAGAAFADEDRWTRMSILNAARVGWFSSDRSIREYADRIWRAEPVVVEL